MSQPNLKTEFFEHAGGYGWVFIVDPLSGLMIKASSAKTKQTAYKRAAAKLRNLADEAERLADED